MIPQILYKCPSKESHSLLGLIINPHIPTIKKPRAIIKSKSLPCLNTQINESMQKYNPTISIKK